MTSKFVYAGFWRRFLAYILDVVLFILSTLAVVLILDMVEPGNSVTAAFIGHDPDFSLALWFIWALAVVDFWVAFRATPGKMLMRIMVVDADTGQSLTIWKAIVRFLAYTVSSIPLCLGFAWIAWDPRKQGWHDKIAGSVVVVRSSPLAKRLEKFPDSAMQGSRQSGPYEGKPGIDAAPRRGEGLLAEWASDGTLIRDKELAAAWGVSVEVVRHAVEKGELLPVFVGDQARYWSGFGVVPRQEVAGLCQAIRGLSPSEQFIFWTRRHRHLQGYTVAEALVAGMHERVLEVARAWKQERDGSDLTEDEGQGSNPSRGARTSQ